MEVDAWYGAGQEPVEFPPPSPPPAAARPSTRPRVKSSSSAEDPSAGKHVLGKHAAGKQVLGAKSAPRGKFLGGSSSAPAVRAKPTDLARRKLAPIFKAGSEGAGAKKGKAAAPKGGAKKAFGGSDVSGVYWDSKEGKAYNQDKSGKRTPCEI